MDTVEDIYSEWISAGYESENFFVGRDSFADLEISPSPRDEMFYYFFNKKKNSLVRRGFVLGESPGGIVYLCEVTLIKKDQKFSPRIVFTKRNKNKKLVRSESKDFQVTSRVELSSFMENFWKLIVYIQGLSFIDVPENAFTFDASVFEKLNIDDLQDLESIVSVKKLNNILGKWTANKNNDSEKFWSEIFMENSWIISQVFACPYVFIGKEYYYGGKRGDDKGGVYGDFLYENELTGNVAFVEIKTPETELVQKSLYLGTDDEDNNAVYSMSRELTGGIVEVLNQRNMLKQKQDGIENRNQVFNSKCVLIIGKTEHLLFGQKKSFDLFRNERKDVEVVTFDELFGRIEKLKEIFSE